MNRSTKKWLITAAFLLLLGALVAGNAIMYLNDDFAKFSEGKYNTKEYTITENYQNICIAVDTADVIFVPAERDVTGICCYEQKNVTHSVSVEGDTLTIQVVDTRQWYEHIGFYFDTPRITVSLPQGIYGTLRIDDSTGDITIPADYQFEDMDIRSNTGDVVNFASATSQMYIQTDTGDIRVENTSAEDISLSTTTGSLTLIHVSCADELLLGVTTGDTVLTGITCKLITAVGSTGDIFLTDVVAEEMIAVDRTTGDVNLTRCDAQDIWIDTDTGDVTGSLLTDKIFITESDTGNIKVPQSHTGGKCEITTDTGDIKITIEN